LKKKVIGDFLFQFYRKRTSSFLANIYKAIITGESEDIHRLRVDVKKIYALYSLFEMIRPDLFKKKVRYNLFLNLFKLSGKIREIQVHQIFLSKPKYKKTDFSDFTAFLKEQENLAVRKFLQEIKGFNDKELKSTEKDIRKICLNISARKLTQKSEEYIAQKAKKIQVLLTEEQKTENVHRIRKYLKAMSTVTSLVFNVRPDEKLGLIISGLNKSEVMIGEWHDKIVLTDIIDLYIKNREETTEDGLIPLKSLCQSLTDDNQELLRRLLPEARKVVELILQPDEADEMVSEEVKKSGGQEVRK
jgi:CHAD domain-containing protein